MKASLKFIGILLAIILFSAWASPLLFRVLPFEYERILNRLIATLVLFAIYFLYVRGQEKKLLLVGLSGPARIRWFVGGFCFGFLVLVSIVAIEFAFGVLKWHPDFSKHIFLYYLGQAVLTGIGVGIFEEWFFRGCLLKSFRNALSLRWSVFWMNAVYSISHFIKAGNLQGGAQPSFINSLALLVGVYTRHEAYPTMMMGFVGLLIFGYILTWAALRTGSLYLSMGIHAGLVTALKFQGKLVQPIHPGWHWFFGDRQYYNGALGWICLIGAWFILRQVVNRCSWPTTTLNICGKENQSVN